MNKNIFLVIKTVSWRFIATISTVLIGFYVTGNIYFGLTIGGFEFVIKTILYFIHEKFWENLKKRSDETS
jgi:uncharacterized membrane protein